MCVLAKDPIPRAAGSIAAVAIVDERSSNLEPLAEVERALLVVEVLHAPHPELGGLLLVGGEHCFCTHTYTQASQCMRPTVLLIPAARHISGRSSGLRGPRHARSKRSLAGDRWREACSNRHQTSGRARAQRRPYAAHNQGRAQAQGGEQSLSLAKKTSPLPLRMKPDVSLRTQNRSRA